jgi:glucose-6-phosphate 1-dehydrogenase
VIDRPVGRLGDPCVKVIFGASGDLTKRKLIPALYNLAKDDLLSRQFAIVGSARRPMTDESFHEKMSEEMYDCMTRDVTLFQRADMVEASWSMVAPILDVWKALPPRNFPSYAAGTWGPKEADELIGRDGRRWRRINA